MVLNIRKCLPINTQNSDQDYLATKSNRRIHYKSHSIAVDLFIFSLIKNLLSKNVP